MCDGLTKEKPGQGRIVSQMWPDETCGTEYYCPFCKANHCDCEVSGLIQCLTCDKWIDIGFEVTA